MEQILNVQIPEGYEIDKAKSTFEKIVFKPIEHLTYKNVCDSLFKHRAFIINYGGEIDEYDGLDEDLYDETFVSYSYDQLNKIIALNYLFNIAKYYNNKAETNNIKYHIQYESNEYIAFGTFQIETGMPFFYNEKDAEEVINNPEFRNILDIIYK